MMSLYIIKCITHAPPSVTTPASPACATWLAEVAINRAAELASVVQMTERASDLELIPPIPAKPRERVEKGYSSQTNKYLWVL